MLTYDRQMSSLIEYRQKFSNLSELELKNLCDIYDNDWEDFIKLVELSIKYNIDFLQKLYEEKFVLGDIVKSEEVEVEYPIYSESDKIKRSIRFLTNLYHDIFGMQYETKKPQSVESLQLDISYLLVQLGVSQERLDREVLKIEPDTYCKNYGCECYLDCDTCPDKCIMMEESIIGCMFCHNISCRDRRNG